MGRVIGAVVAGYAVMFLVVFLTLTGAYLAMGTDGAFQPGTYEVSVQWIAVSLVLGLLAAVAGGWVGGRLGGPRSRQAIVALAIVVLVLGIASALPTLLSDDTAPQPRHADVPNMEAMMNARTPLWIALLTPLLGVFGVFAGGRIAGEASSR
jgi:cytochrome bd-type quinol oxidase subunit 2